MRRQATTIGAAAVLMLALAAPVSGEITSIAGFTQAEVTEVRPGLSGDIDRATESYPGTASEFPLQVVARLIAADLDEEAAAAVATQLADPRELIQPNPEEFAINLALNSVSSNVHYEARAVSQEDRDVVFAPGDLDPLSQAGDRVSLAGRLFLDGALTILAVDPAKDLTGAFVLLRVTVVQTLHEGGEDPQERTVFTGELELRGEADGEVTVVTAGTFPAGQLVLTDLSGLSDEFGAFQVLVIPAITVDYPYAATVGEPFSLRATVAVEAANVAGESGVAAVLGTPVDTLNQVIALTHGEVAAEKTIAALENERDNPTGIPAVSNDPSLPGPLLPACGLVGFESLIGMTGLVGLRRLGPRRAKSLRD